ncbi:4299_t:CDS:1 [Paraglomus brasilianum]|uniref:4299_t:CDS:1 n=1 Tax=Paraglomus brasilianum TaxID=144538 RepID=A0A9N9H9F6_9GLOM|nr:4299_t:CDS:1 [Paraglomus brasilianum]
MAIFNDDLMKKFDEEYGKAHPYCSKEELLAYNTKPNKNGHPRRTRNAALIYLKEYSKQLKSRGNPVYIRGGAKTLVKQAMEEWNLLGPSQRLLYELAAAIIEKKFKETYPGYKFMPQPKKIQTIFKPYSKKCAGNISPMAVQMPETTETNGIHNNSNVPGTSFSGNCSPSQSSETSPDVESPESSFILSPQLSPPTSEAALSNESLEYTMTSKPEQQPTVEYVYDNDLYTGNASLHGCEELNDQLDLFEEESKKDLISNTNYYSYYNLLYQYF